MCGTETGKQVKDKTVTGPTMGLTCNKREPKVRPSLSFYQCSANFAAGMKGSIIIHICKKKDFLCYPHLSHPLVLLFSNILTCLSLLIRHWLQQGCLSFIFFQIRFLIKIDKKLKRDMAEETYALLKNPYDWNHPVDPVRKDGERVR